VAAAAASASPQNLPDAGMLLDGHPTETHLTVIADHVARASAENMLIGLRTVRIVRQPGQKPAHSNVAAPLLCMILSRVFHTPYVSLLNRFIERPLGMTQSERPRQVMNTSGYATDTSNAAPYLQGEIMLAAGGLALHRP